MIVRIRTLQPLGAPRGPRPTTCVALWGLALLILSLLFVSAVESLPERPHALLAAPAVLAPAALTAEPSCLDADGAELPAGLLTLDQSVAAELQLAQSPRARAQECPYGQPPVACTVDPCRTSTCPAFPRAVCKANYCGGCNAEWFVNGKQVACETAEATGASITCDNARCPAGAACTLQQVACVREPCPPIPVCLPTEPPVPDLRQRALPRGHSLHAAAGGLRPRALSANPRLCAPGALRGASCASSVLGHCPL